jgi:hypothetical protein
MSIEITKVSVEKMSNYCKVNITITKNIDSTDYIIIEGWQLNDNTYLHSQNGDSEDTYYFDIPYATPYCILARTGSGNEDYYFGATPS